LNDQSSKKHSRLHYFDSTSPNPTTASSKNDTKMPVITMLFLMLAHLYAIPVAAFISAILITPSSNLLKIWDRATALPTLPTEKQQLSTTLVMSSTQDGAMPVTSRMSKRHRNLKCTTVPSINEMPMGGMQCSVM
jgi:hypothetical protein